MIAMMNSPLLLTEIDFNAETPAFQGGSGLLGQPGSRKASAGHAFLHCLRGRHWHKIRLADRSSATDVGTASHANMIGHN
jgi:hypothetical protein